MRHALRTLVGIGLVLMGLVIIPAAPAAADHAPGHSLVWDAKVRAAGYVSSPCNGVGVYVRASIDPAYDVTAFIAGLTFEYSTNNGSTWTATTIASAIGPGTPGDGYVEGLTNSCVGTATDVRKVSLVVSTTYGGNGLPAGNPLGLDVQADYTIGASADATSRYDWRGQGDYGSLNMGAPMPNPTAYGDGGDVADGKLPELACERSIQPSRDPAYAFELNLAGYVRNAPVNATDEAWWSVEWAGPFLDVATYNAALVAWTPDPSFVLGVTGPTTAEHSVMPEGGWIATYHVRRTYDAGHLGDWGGGGGGDWIEGEAGGTYDDPWWHDDIVFLPESVQQQIDDAVASLYGEWGGNVPAAIVDALVDRLAGGYMATNDNGATYVNGQTTPPKVVEATCKVLINPARPETGGRQTVYPPNDPETTPPPTDAGCGIGGSIPIIGGLLEGVTGLVCAIGGLLEGLLDALLAFFTPPSDLFDGFLDGLSDTFPLNIADGLLAALGDIGVAFTNSVTAGDPCFTLPVGDVINEGVSGPITSDFTAVEVRLPTPAVAGCASTTHGMNATADESIGDLGGYRPVIRGILAFLLYVGFAYKVIGLFIPGGDDMEVGAT